MCMHALPPRTHHHTTCSPPPRSIVKVVIQLQARPLPVPPHTPTACIVRARAHTHTHRSIIKQSYDARERKGDPSLPFHLRHGNLNGDGFGIGWFSSEERRAKDPTPCVFTSITPAWCVGVCLCVVCTVVYM